MATATRRRVTKKATVKKTTTKKRKPTQQMGTSKQVSSKTSIVVEVPIQGQYFKTKAQCGESVGVGISMVGDSIIVGYSRGRYGGSPSFADAINNGSIKMSPEQTDNLIAALQAVRDEATKAKAEAKKKATGKK